MLSGGSLRPSPTRAPVVHLDNARTAVSRTLPAIGHLSHRAAPECCSPSDTDRSDKNRSDVARTGIDRPVPGTTCGSDQDLHRLGLRRLGLRSEILRVETGCNGFLCSEILCSRASGNPVLSNPVLSGQEFTGMPECISGHIVRTIAVLCGAQRCRTTVAEVKRWFSAGCHFPCCHAEHGSLARSGSAGFAPQHAWRGESICYWLSGVSAAY